MRRSMMCWALIGVSWVVGTIAVAADSGVVVTKVWPDKLVYGFDSPGTCTVTVVAPGKAMEGQNKEMRAVHLKVELLSGLDREQTLCDQVVELAVAETKQIPVPFRTGKKADGAEYGYEVRATITAEGQSNTVAREYFMVTDNPLKIGHLTIPAGQTDHRQWTPGFGVDTMREMYFCMAEAPFWAPCDFSELTTTREFWTSGQAGRYMSEKGMKAQADAVHAMGGWMVIYCDKWACGPVGFEHARRHPEWYHWGQDWYGCKFDVQMLDWIAEPTFKDGKWKEQRNGGIWAICPLIAKPEVAAFGIAQIVGSCKQFGWDGIRFDNCGWYVDDVKDIYGHPAVKPGTDIPTLEADLVRQIRAAGEQVTPHFVYGDNMDFQTDIAKASPRWRAEAAAGGLVMAEGMRSTTHAGSLLNNWKYLREYLNKAIPTVRHAGGHPYGIVFPASPAQHPEAARVESSILIGVLLASGMHLCYTVTPPSFNYMRLYARHCGLLYDDKLQFIGEPEKLLAVAGPREIWWKEYVRRRELPDRSTQFIVHLINPSTGERVLCGEGFNGITNPIPETQKSISVTVTPPDGVTVKRAFRITADKLAAPDTLELPVKQEGGKAVVTVPELVYWDIVVFEGTR